VNIKKKLQLIVIVTGGVALLVFGLILAWTSRQVSEAIEQNKVMDKVVKGVFELNIITNDYMLRHQERAQAQWQLRYRSLAKLLTKVEAKDPEEEILGRVIQNHAEIQPLFSQVVANYDRRGFSESEIALSMDLERRLVSQLAVKAQTMVEDTFRLAGTAKTRLEGAQGRGSFLLVAFGVIILTLMVSVIVLTSNNIVARITNLHQGTEIIAAGDLDYQVDVGSRDEIGSLAHAFNEMTRQLRGSYEALKQKITERKQAVEELRLERDNMVNIFEAMEDGMYIVNQQYDIQYVNAVLKKDFGPYEDRKCYEYLHDRKEVCPWCKNQDVFAGKNVHWEWYSFKNQKTYDLLDTPLRNPDGTISKLEIFRDITERKQAEEELEKHKEHLERLVRERTDELQKTVNLMAGREVRMAELKEAIKKLRAQLEETGLTPVADDPLKEGK